MVDKNMKMSEYQKLAVRTECNNHRARTRLFVSPDTDIKSDQEGATDKHLLATRLLHAALGMGSEAGELMSKIRRWIYYGKSLSKVEIAEELGDIAWFFALGCTAINVDAGVILAANIEKLAARYPEKFSYEREEHNNRDLAKEDTATRMVLDGDTPLGYTPDFTERDLDPGD